VDKTLVDRFIIAFPMLPETVRGIRLGLRLLLGVTRPVGYISQTLTAAGAQAETENGSLYVPLPILGEADEIFQGRQPCLTVVDGRSFLVVYLVPDESRDGTTWRVTYIEPGRGCGHPPGAAGCRESDLGHPGSVPPFLQSGRAYQCSNKCPARPGLGLGVRRLPCVHQEHNGSLADG
jgi:hypothetical protein